MTWYAHEILLRATPAALQAIRGSALANFSYHLRHLDGFDWYAPEHRHGLSEGGLLVIRPVCSAQAMGARWHGQEILDIASLQAPADVQALLNADLDVLLKGDYLNPESVPTYTLRSTLAALARQIGEPVVYYACGMWGGDLDYEYCLAYQPAETLMMTDTSDRGHRAQRALLAGLQLLGLNLPSAFFAPHTRSFNWSAHALAMA